MMKYSIFFLLLLFAVFNVSAQTSWIYIEGMKGIPFFVRSNSKVVPKLASNHYIITCPEAGEYSIEISFINSNFKNQTFIVDVRPNSAYGYRMGKTVDQTFYLIDVVNDGKIIEANTPVNISLSTYKNFIRFGKDVNSERDSSEANLKVDVAKRQKKSRKSDERTLDSSSTVRIDQLPDTELIEVDSSTLAIEKERTKTKKAPKVKEKSDSLLSAKPSLPASKAFRTRTCDEVAKDEEVKSMVDKIKGKQDDDAKLLVVKKQVLSGCFTVPQIALLLPEFSTQYNRFALLKFVYPLTHHPEDMITLASFLKSDNYKQRLRKLLEN
jgi:hypothetical protein